ncbi:molybdate/tungstate transport system substrate-binding protein [Halogranum gelatinilyticum]|uniref:Molybdate/tungstate transport system substrate-binding protein n=1 Tax=Halogranum gelatinilyticum TaxID=660521 RepID=A0A1G9UQR5_9EURY|nr:extracellular solute-binding protein [Halogranum gelatinilyticum]SDM61865.1 molybdate/tungstate transport system substrate-binding protein [Halogranum gelatinilyticum]
MARTRRQILRVAGGGLGLTAAGAVGFRATRGDATGDTAADDVDALVAGSLLVLADSVPGATVEAHGSLTVRNLVVDGARDPDVLALADPTLFEGIADEVTLFATNALVIAYNPDSAAADAIATDWREALARDDVRIGRTDPKADPLGYRTVFALDLADRPDLLEHSSIFPETALMQTLETGKLDAAFVYRNMAVEHDLPFVELPPELDFSDPAFADEYAQASLDLPGRTVRGAPIRYGATALTDAGESWLDALVSDTDRLREHGFTVPESYPASARTPPGGRSD